MRGPDLWKLQQRAHHGLPSTVLKNECHFFVCMLLCCLFVHVVFAVHVIETEIFNFLIFHMIDFAYNFISYKMVYSTYYIYIVPHITNSELFSINFLLTSIIAPNTEQNEDL